MNPRALLLAMLLASPALAAAPAFRILHAEDAAPSTVPLLAPEATELPFSFHLPPLKLQPTGALATTPLPLPPLELPGAPDDGGGAGVSGDVTGVLGILLALFVGFGTGHLVVRDRDGFILFLIIDVVIIAVSSVLHFATPFTWLGYYGLGSLLLLISHLIQVLDVYGKAFGGGRILDRVRDTTVLIEQPGRGPDPALPGTHRMFRFSF
jgi:hypothetical protein